MDDKQPASELRDILRSFTKPVIDSLDARLGEQIDARISERLDDFATRLAVLERAVASIAGELATLRSVDDVSSFEGDGPVDLGGDAGHVE